MALPPSLQDPSQNGAKARRSRWLRPRLLRILVGIVVTAAITHVPLDYLESICLDLRIRTRPSPPNSGNVEMIIVNNDTLKKYNGLPNFQQQANLLQILKSANPRAVVYTKRFVPMRDGESKMSDDVAKNPWPGTAKEMQNFIAAAKGLPEFWIQTDFMARDGEKSKMHLADPFGELPVGSGPTTADRYILARDGVTRRTLLTYQGQPLLHLHLATLIRPELKIVDNIRGKIDLYDSEQVYINYLRPGSFPISEFGEVLSGKIPAEHFRNKIVLIGDDIGASLKDYVATSYNRDAEMPMPELHANMIDSILRDASPRPLGGFIDSILTLMIALMTITAVLTLKPVRGIIVVVSTALTFVLLCYVAFWGLNLWVPMAHSLCAIFLCYYFLIPYRLILENRISWEYYEKHKLLQQVEELKTNFISMMSHDLKTPIARIQGMVDIISKDKVILSGQQQEAVDTIRSSSSDLLGFINSILNYAKIENQGVVLHKEGKDINQLLEQVIKRYDFMARVKGMKINRDLEPMFSLRLDPELMKQVFGNLLENAIKYSPEGSEVLVRSYERDGSVLIEFQDQGEGIAEDDLPHVFMKFFRSKNAKSSPIKGSGLGLYLAKYFVELHDGLVFVTSTPGKGSTFTVKLPVTNT